MTVQKKPLSKQDQKPSPEPTNLVRRYGEIGIAALVAALQFSTSTKKPSSTSTFTKLDERFVDQVV